jgi:hypothetical protein
MKDLRADSEGDFCSDVQHSFCAGDDSVVSSFVIMVLLGISVAVDISIGLGWKLDVCSGGCNVLQKDCNQIQTA